MIAPVSVVFHEARQSALEFPRAKVLLEPVLSEYRAAANLESPHVRL